MRVGIKVCGITRLHDALLAHKLGAWAIGFVFAPKSSRGIARDAARVVCAQLPPRLVKIGVVVNMPADEVNALAVDVGLDYVQLHGDEPADFGRALNCKYIRAARSRSAQDLQILAQDQGAEMVLVDAAVSGDYGGTGMLADWMLAKDAKKFGKKMILAGGLNAQNVQAACATVQPDYIDVSSALEASPGIKDADKMKQFFEAAI